MEVEVGGMVKMEEEMRLWGGEDGGTKAMRVWVRWGEGGHRLKRRGLGAFGMVRWHHVKRRKMILEWCAAPREKKK
ncbi:hypothetical protein ACFX13_048121 [Malus domestica]